MLGLFKQSRIKAMPILLRLTSFFISSLMFGAVIYFIQPPKSWAESSTLQILLFFIPLLLVVTSFLNIIFRSIWRSFTLGLGVVVMVVLWAIGQFNLVTAVMTILASGFLAWSQPKARLTKRIRMPKLSSLRRLK